MLSTANARLIRMLMYLWWLGASAILGVATIGFLFFPRHVALNLDDYSAYDALGKPAGAERDVVTTLEFLIRVIGCFMLLSWAGFEGISMRLAGFRTILTNWIMLDFYALASICGLVLFSRNWVFSTKVTQAFLICYAVFLFGTVSTGIDLLLLRMCAPAPKPTSVALEVVTLQPPQPSAALQRARSHRHRYKNRRDVARGSTVV